ncbi:MAG: hypothetical protein L3J41_12845 [Melioribacteraceae bacterium]|nr:hypothetical protein [Melioribacteraceae bacterium]
MLATEELNSLTQQLGYANIEDAAAKQVVLVLMSKISKYKLEVNLFNNKYKCSLSEALKKNKTENFEYEDDLLDWEFAALALKKNQELFNKLTK